MELDFECEGGYEVFNCMLEKGLLFSLIFVLNDMMVMGVFNVVYEKGICIFEDVFIMGYDDIYIVCFMFLVLIIVY